MKLPPKTARGRVLAHYRKVGRWFESDELIGDGFIIFRKGKESKQFKKDMINIYGEPYKRKEEEVKKVLNIEVKPLVISRYWQILAKDFAEYYKLELGGIRKGKRILLRSGQPVGAVVRF